MNPREKNLLAALIAVVSLGVVALATWMWFVVPLRDYNRKIVVMQAENNKTQAQIDEFNAGRKKLALARIKSLPASDEAGSEYMNYLHTVLPENGLKVDEMTRSQNPVEVKPVSSIPGIKKVGHQMLTFQVKARGTMAQLVSALEAMQKTPYEHRIKSLIIDRAETQPKDANTKLVVNMIIETLLVAKTESKPGIPPGVDVKGIFLDSLTAQLGGPPGLGQVVATLILNQATPASTGDRQYADIAKRNIFVGAMPKPPAEKKKKDVAVVEAPQPQPPGPMLKFIRLVGVEPTAQEAHFLNLFYRKDERKISAKENSGYNTFLIAADDLSYTFFLGKVLRVDHRDVFFQVKDKVYKWHVGDTLEYAFENYLTLDYLDAIDLEPDFAWAKKELENEKVKESTKKKTGRTK